MLLCSNPRAQYLSYKAEIDAAIARVLDRGRYILGEEVAAFESEFAAFLGAKEAIGVASGTDALHIALRACGIGPGDEVITVSHTAVATIAAIELCGARPVLVDVRPDTYTIDPARLEAAIGGATKAIVPVHLYGHPADIADVLAIAQRHGLKVIEDCAQAHGAMVGTRRVSTWGDAGCFSFYPTKNLGALGDGGAVVTNDRAVAHNARLLREYGWSERYVSSKAGWNSRLDELQAAVLRIKLRHLDGDNAARRRIASAYAQGLEGTGVLLPQEVRGATHVYHLYVVRVNERDRLLEHLRKNDIGALIHYPVPVHLQPAYSGRLAGHDQLPETERAAREVLSLPMYPELTLEQTALVCRIAQAHLKATA
jgi:dTDP-4-amino-4,6-dideoxygalactose transaminase